MLKFGKTITLTFSNNKGGSGKTSQCGLIGKFLSNRGYKILFVDADMQGNLTQSTGMMNDTKFYEDMEFKNLALAIHEEANIKNHILKTDIENIDIVPFHEELARIELDMFTKNAREHIFERMFEEVKNEKIYDFILIDVNPSLGILTHNAVDISDHCISPVHPSGFGIRTIPVLMRFLSNVKKYSNNFKSVKFCLNNYDLRKTNITRNVENFLKTNYDDILFKTIIPVDINIEYSQIQGKYLDLYKKDSRACEAYERYVDEILEFLKEENTIIN